MATENTPIPPKVTTSIRNAVHEMDGRPTIKQIDRAGKDDFQESYTVILQDGRQLTYRTPRGNYGDVLKAEVATMKYIADHTEYTSKLVPRVLGYKFPSTTNSNFYAIYEKPVGERLSSVEQISSANKERLVKELVTCMLELFQHRFTSIGSLTFNDELKTYSIGPIVTRPFYAGGRAIPHLDRGPFETAKAYYLACVEREKFAQCSSPPVQHASENSQLYLRNLSDLVDGLDNADPELAPFSLDIRKIGERNILVLKNNPSKIVALVDWQFICTRPLWCCGSLPSSLSLDYQIEEHLKGDEFFTEVVKESAKQLDVPDALFLKASKDHDSTWRSLNILVEWDGSLDQDNVLLLPLVLTDEDVGELMDPAEADEESIPIQFQTYRPRAL